MEGGSWDLVVVDVRLEGPTGPDTGLDLLDEIRRRNPEPKIVLVTGHATSEAVERAFGGGAYDFLEKTDVLPTLLRAKARAVLELARERRFAAVANGNREALIRDLWSHVIVEANPQLKGRYLEDLILLVFKSIPGFERASTNRSSEDEQFDLLVPNESTDPIWQKESPFFIGECKNWTKPVQREDADAFINRLRRRRSRALVGFYFAVGGATAGFKKVVEESRLEDFLVMLLERAEIEELVGSRDRNSLLKKFHESAVLGAHTAR